MKAKIFVILFILLFVLGCASNDQAAQKPKPEDVQSNPQTAEKSPAIPDVANPTKPAEQSALPKLNDKSQIKLDRVVYCADEPSVINPEYCNQFVNSKSSSERIYIAAVANDLECQNSSVSATCTIILFQNGKEVFNQSKPISDTYKGGCKEPERRKALCKIYVQGPTDVTKFYSANFEIKDMYSGQMVIAKGAEATIVPQGTQGQ